MRTSRRGLSLIELLVVLAIIGLIFALCMPVTRSAGPAARRTQCKNNLKQIGLALHNYSDVWGSLPPAYTVDAEGNRLHSWRTLILPYLDQAPLYKTIDLSKAWNDPVNSTAFETSVSPYRCPSIDGPNTNTTYLAIAVPEGIFPPGESRRFSDITRKHGETVMVVEVDAEQAVHWMSPVDADEELMLRIGPKSKLAHTGGVHALFADGSVQFLSAEASADQRRDWMSISGTRD